MRKQTSVTEIEELFKTLGLRSGETVLVFSNAASLGLTENGLSGIYQAFKNVLGPQGTLVVPTFTFSFCNSQIFDLQNTRSICGAFTNFVRTIPGAIRSIHGNHSFAAIGNRAEDALVATDKSSFGAGSALTSMLALNVKILLLGVIHNTYIHYVEKRFKVEYRYDKYFTGMVRDGKHVYQDTFVFFVRKLGLEGTSTKDREPQRNLFFETSACKTVDFVYGTHRLHQASDFCEFMLNELNKDPLFLVDKRKYFESLKKETDEQA